MKLFSSCMLPASLLAISLLLGGCAASSEPSAEPAGSMDTVKTSDLPPVAGQSSFRANPSVPIKYALKKGTKGSVAGKSGK